MQQDPNFKNPNDACEKLREHVTDITKERNETKIFHFKYIQFSMRK